MSQQAQNIINSVKVLTSLGAELETLKREIETQLTEIAGDIRFDAWDEKDCSEIYNSAGEGWVLDGWHWTFPARRRAVTRGRGQRVGSLSIAVDLGRSGWVADALGFPVLMVAWAHQDDEWASFFGAEAFSLRQEDSVTLLDEALAVWSEEAPDGNLIDLSWVYIMPLLSIGDRAKVKSMIVDPVIRLVSGAAPSESLQGVDAVRFSWVDGEARPVADNQTRQ